MEKIEDILKGRPLVLVQFGLESCLPCHNIREKILWWQTQHPLVSYEYVDMAEHAKLCGQLEIFAAPTLVLFADGKKSLQASRSFSLLEVMELAEKYEKMME